MNQVFEFDLFGLALISYSILSLPHPPPALLHMLVLHLISRSVIRRARLYLAQSEAGDSGNYTCVCDQKLRHTVRLVVTLGTTVVITMAIDERKYVDDNIYHCVHLRKQCNNDPKHTFDDDDDVGNAVFWDPLPFFRLWDASERFKRLPGRLRHNCPKLSPAPHHHHPPPSFSTFFPLPTISLPLKKPPSSKINIGDHPLWGPH